MTPDGEHPAWAAARPIPPCPTGDPLAIRLRCWTSRAARSPFTRHPAVLNPDWSVEVPHDLAAERVAMALGGWLSCLELEATVVPAARQWLGLLTRTVIPPIRMVGHRAWGALSPQRCCPVRGFDSPAHAFEHVQELRHISHESGARIAQLRDLTQPIGEQWHSTDALTIPQQSAHHASELLTGGRQDVSALWYCGVHPDRLVEIHTRIGVPGRLPTGLYLSTLTRHADLDWLGTTMRDAGVAGTPAEDMGTSTPRDGDALGGQGGESVAEWLVRTHGPVDEYDPSARGRWLRLGVSRDLILVLAKAGYDPDDVARLAAAIGRSPDGAARVLTGWMAGRMKPRIDDLIALHRTGRVSLWRAPPAASVERVHRELARPDLGSGGAFRSRRGRPTRLEVAFLLALCGNARDTIAAWRGGATWQDQLGSDDSQPRSRHQPAHPQPIQEASA